MFSYYGSKSKIVDVYPPPKFDRIIEPFCGAAKYSLRYFNNDVVIIDKYKVIIDVWLYLQEASIKDIISLPDVEYGDDLRKYNLSEVEKNFIAFVSCGGISVPQYKIGKFGNFMNSKVKISKELFKIRHWTILHGDYNDLENKKATWFVDPPYQFGGHKYKESNKKLDFEKLSTWCKNRNGQVIVCENTKAQWLDFKPMVTMQGQMFQTTEAIWSNLPTNFDNEQLNLF